MGQAAKTMRPPKQSRLGKPLMTLACAIRVACNGPGAQAETETITNAADVRALNAHEAAQGLPVRLQAVVIDQSDPRDHALAVIDRAVGLYVTAATTNLAGFHRGDLLELTGVTDPGQFAPIVKVSAARKLGTAPLPEPMPATYYQLMTGALDGQWVELPGVVQQYLPPAGGTGMRQLVLAVDGGMVHVRVVDPHDPALQEDAEVRVRALCFYQFNEKRQMLRPVLQVPPGIPVTVEKAAPSDPFAAPVRSATSLLLFSPENSFGHRIHLRGAVTYGQPGASIWIRDESAGLRLQARSPSEVRPGDLLDVLGFPKFGSPTPTLADAIYRKLGTAAPPAPVQLAKPTDAFDHEDDLVSLKAKLSEVVPVLEGLALSLDATGAVFKAVLKLPPNTQTQARPDWQPGSFVRVTGICSVIYDDTRPTMGIWHPQSFQLLLRSPADLLVLQAPSWWTLRHVSFLLALATAVLGAATGGITLLARRRLREQEQHRVKAETEFAAILSERNRVAREIHDTLAQGLVATSLQLRLAKRHAHESSEPLTRHLQAAQELVRGSLAEARNSIWNMRSQVLETGDLPNALDSILKQMAAGSELKTQFRIIGRPRRLAPVVENNLLRVGQEAITNAARHAQASHISVQLDFLEKQFRLAVTDNGRGFKLDGEKQNGHFGLVGMRERARELQGALDIRSAPGQGTEIVLTVPLPSE
jgi:signal transduction histidine kinase